MTKIIKYERKVENCRMCPYSTVYTKNRYFLTPVTLGYFCTSMWTWIKDLQEGTPVMEMIKKEDKEKTYAYLENPDVIPNWCPLQEYNE